jgi:hypothetical protein
MASELCQTACSVWFVVMKPRIPSPERYSSLHKFPTKLTVRKHSGMPPYEMRKLGVSFTESHTSVEVRTCSAPVSQECDSYAVAINCSKTVQKHRIRIQLFKNTITASVTWCFYAISLLVKKSVFVRYFTALMNSVPIGSKENNTSIVKVLKDSLMKINALYSFETMGTD